MLAVPADPGRWRGLAVLALAVLAMHAALLAGIDGAGLQETSAAPAVQVRSVPAPAPPPDAPVTAPPLAPVAPAPRARPARAERRMPAVPADAAAAAQAPAASASQPETLRAEAPIEAPPSAIAEAPSPASAAVAVADAVDAAEPAEPAGSAATAPELPTYRTLLPPPAILYYDLQRGRFGGSGELRWQRDGEHYALSLEGSVVGIKVLAQLSRGGLDAAGLAPQRFTDQRARRPVQAANFQRDLGKVTFSGPSHELPWRAGVQDRLSWMIQLAAVAAAEPALREPGARVALQVVGARGDAGVWVFRCLGPAPLEVAGVALDTLRYAREPRSLYDTAVEIWLDPARHHLPVRATTHNGAEGDGLELRLREAAIGQ
jgi:hypothetical protein